MRRFTKPLAREVNVGTAGVAFCSTSQRPLFRVLGWNLAPLVLAGAERHNRSKELVFKLACRASSVCEQIRKANIQRNQEKEKLRELGLPGLGEHLGSSRRQGAKQRGPVNRTVVQGGPPPRRSSRIQLHHQGSALETPLSKKKGGTKEDE